MQAGRNFSEEEVKQFALAILSILDYLHSRQPPVIHRDIKPSNILLTNRSGNSIGDVYLVDFGSVQSLATKKGSTITVVGTYGYMPPEQFGGKAKAASDLYSLGATLIYLVTGQHPADLPETDQVIEFEQFANISQALTNWLKKMTQPSLSRRFVSVKDALESLKTSSDENKQRTTKEKKIKKETKNKKPNDSKVTLTKNSQFLEIVIPPIGLNSSVTYINIFLSLIFCLLLPLLPTFFINTAHNAMALEALQIDYAVALFKLIGYPFSIAVCGGIIYFLFKVFLGVFGKMRFRLDRKQISLIYELFGIQRHSPLPSLRKNIQRIEQIQTDYKAIRYLAIWAGKNKYELSANPHFPLTTPEVYWLAEEISNLLNLPVAENSSINEKHSSEQLVFYFRRVEQLYEKGDYQSAIFELDTAIQKYPNSATAYYNRGKLYFHLNDYQAAIKDYSRAIEIDPLSTEIYYIRANTYLISKDYQSAIQDCDRAIKLDPECIKAFCFRATAYLNLGEYQKAIKDCNFALQLNPKLDMFYFIRANVYLNLKDYANAIKDCDRAIEINPKMDSAYYTRGASLYHLKNYKNAIADCDRAIQLDPKMPEAYFIRGSANLYLGNFQNAIADCTQTIELNPQLAEAYFIRGKTYLYLKNYQKAIEDSNCAIQLDSQLAEAYYVRASVVINLPPSSENYQNAFKDADRAIQLNPQLDLAYYVRGSASFHLRDYQNAIEDCNRAIQLNSELAEAYYLKGASQHNLGLFQDALPNCDRAIQLNPQLAEAYFFRGSVHFNLNNYQEALKDFDRTIQLNPQLVEAYCLRAATYCYLNNYQKALEDFDRAIQLNPNIDNVYFLRGNALTYFGDVRGALEDFTKQVELIPNANNFYNLGVTQYFLGINSEAIASFSKVLELDSKVICAYYNRSNSYYELEQKEEALKDFDRALELENQSENALSEEDEHGYYARGLAKYRMSDDITGAIADLEKAAEIALKHKFTDFHQRVSDRLKEI